MGCLYSKVVDDAGAVDRDIGPETTETSDTIKIKVCELVEGIPQAKRAAEACRGHKFVYDGADSQISMKQIKAVLKALNVTYRAIWRKNKFLECTYNALVSPEVARTRASGGGQHVTVINRMNLPLIVILSGSPLARMVMTAEGNVQGSLQGFGLGGGVAMEFAPQHPPAHFRLEPGGKQEVPILGGNNQALLTLVTPGYLPGVNNGEDEEVDLQLILWKNVPVNSLEVFTVTRRQVRVL